MKLIFYSLAHQAGAKIEMDDLPDIRDGDSNSTPETVQKPAWNKNDQIDILWHLALHVQVIFQEFILNNLYKVFVLDLIIGQASA